MTRRTLVILRHGKAERPTDVPDHERPLTDRGHADAAAAGAWLAARGYRPDLVICSPARRTRQTWHAVRLALAGGAEPAVRYEPAVYERSAVHLLTMLAETDPDHSTVLLVGHNPTVSLLSIVLDRSAQRDSDGLRTSGLAVHARDGSWKELADGAPMIAAHTARA
jgi:phosphohistidine phosphatase